MKTRHLLLLLISLSLCLWSSTAFAAARTWDGGGGGDTAASTAANWDGDTVIASGDTVTFDATSGNNCTWDITTTVNALDAQSGYTGTITCTATMNCTGGALTLNADFDANDQTINAASVDASGSATRTVDCGSGTWEISGNINVSGTNLTWNEETSTFEINVNGTDTITTGSQEFYNFTFDPQAANQTCAVSGTLVVNGTWDLAKQNYSMNVSGGSYHAKGDIKSTATSSSVSLNQAGSEVLTINGAGAQILETGGSGAYFINIDITVNKSAGTLSLKNFTCDKWTHTAGTIDSTTYDSTVIWRGGGYTNSITSGSGEWDNWQFYGSNASANTTTLGDAAICNGNVDLGDGNDNQIFNGYTLTVEGTLQHTGGAGNVSGTTEIIFGGSNAQSWTFGSSGDFSSPLSFGKSGGSVTLDANKTVKGVLDLHQATSTQTINGYKIFAETTVEGSAGSGDTDGTTTLEFSGSNSPTVTWSSSGSLDIAVIINKASGTLTFGSDIDFGGTGVFTYTAGTVDFGSYEVRFSGSKTISSNPLEFNDLTFAPYLTITLGNNLTVGGAIDFGDAFGNDTFNSNTIYAKGNVDRTGTGSVLGTSALEFTGTAAQSFTTTGCVVGGLTHGFGLPITVNKASNTLTLTSVIHLRGGGSWTYTTGTVAAGTSEIIITAGSNSYTITDGTTQFYKFTNNLPTPSASTLSIPSDLYITNTFDVLNDNFCNVQISGGTIYASGDIIQTQATGGSMLSVSGGALVINGSGTQTLTQNHSSDSYCWNIPTTINSTGTVVFSGTLRFGNTLTYTAGTVTTTGSTVRLCANATWNVASIDWNNVGIAAGTLTLSAGLSVDGTLLVDTGGTISCEAQTLTLSANFTENGTFTAGTSTVVFDSTSTLSNSNSTTAFYNLTFNPGTTITLTIGDTYTTAVGATFTAWGTPSSGITLSSSSASSYADLDVLGSQAVAYVTATDIDSSGGETVKDYNGTLTRTLNWTLTGTYAYTY